MFLTQAAVMIVVLIIIGILADRFPVPDDAPNEVPFPDDGENVPGPEWLFLLLWQPFWYFKGMMSKYLFLTALTPMALGLFFIFLPYFRKIPLNRVPGLKVILEKARAIKSLRLKGFVYAIPALVFALALGVGVYKSGHQAKILGCDACHNPAMGHRMSIPPMDVGRYYSVERAMQIQVGKYRAGKSAGVTSEGTQNYVKSAVEGYKDADWQMRHMYEPTFTW